MNSVCLSSLVLVCTVGAFISNVSCIISTERGASKMKEEEEGVYKSWQLDNTRFVKVKEYRGKLYVDIREHYEKNGQMLPGKKGIQLSLLQFKVLYFNIRHVDWVIQCCLGEIPVNATTLGPDEMYLKKTFRFY
uniref:RNA polymerase II transcriptional coactivator n=1 Tax=Cacopsylla melanoneura TaxID=428564 RepID=A0A8D9FJS2_9HEMI